MKMRVVVGIGDTDFRAPLRWAIEELYFAGASLHLVHCIVGRLSTEMPYLNDEDVADGQLVNDDAVSFASECGATVDAEVREGFAGEILVECSNGAGLLVIGPSRERKLFQTYGQSVVKYCIRYAQCPMTIVPNVRADQISRTRR